MKVRTRIFLVFVLVMAAGIYLLADWFKSDLRPRHLQAQEVPLVDTVELLAVLIARDWQPIGPDTQALRQLFDAVYRRQLSAQIYTFFKDRVDVRVYVTDARGIVLFDSSGNAEGQDYSRWNDVARTLRGEYGARQTHGDPLYKGSVMYVAAPIRVDNRIVGVVSVGKPSATVDRFEQDATTHISLAALVAVAASVAVALFLYGWVSRPIKQLTAYANAVRAGERVALPDLGRNEFAQMGEAMEEMRRSLDGKTYVEHYVQTLTHELKSPLAAIRGAAELLDDPGMSAKDRSRFITSICTEADRARQFIERLLSLVALENRNALSDPQPYSLGGLVDEVIERLQPLARQRSITINKTGSTTDCRRGEAFLISQAIFNLIHNALDFSPDGSPIQIDLSNMDGQAVLCVRDHGPGIPEYALPRLFERFYSLGRPDGRKGTGLGLAFVREVASLHKGSVTLRNHPDGGAEATLRLPVASD